MRLGGPEWFALCVALACGAVGGALGYRTAPYLQFATVALWGVLGILALMGALRAVAVWRRDRWRDRWRALVHPALALGGFVLWYYAGGLGAWQRDLQFVRALPAYERVVAGYRSGAVRPGRLPPDSLPAEIRGCCYRVEGGRDSAGRLFVEFWTERGFPVNLRHAGWLYYSGDSVREIARARAWYHGYRVAPHWYCVDDF